MRDDWYSSRKFLRLWSTNHLDIKNSWCVFTPCRPLGLISDWKPPALSLALGRHHRRKTQNSLLPTTHGICSYIYIERLPPGKTQTTESEWLQHLQPMREGPRGWGHQSPRHNLTGNSTCYSATTDLRCEGIPIPRELEFWAPAWGKKGLDPDFLYLYLRESSPNP